MSIAAFIEQTNLNPVVTIGDIDRLVAEAMQYQFFGICVPPFWVKRAKREIGKENITLVTVAGFPLGFNMTETKLDEIQRAIDNGADEIDVVWNISSFKTGLPWTKIELARCSNLAHANHKLLKVIVESSYLSAPEISRACKICADAGADFVKTSTGFAPGGGASTQHISLMKKALPGHVGIKASGGIKTLQSAEALIRAGAQRIGTSSGVSIATSNHAKD